MNYSYAEYESSETFNNNSYLLLPNKKAIETREAFMNFLLNDYNSSPENVIFLTENQEYLNSSVMNVLKNPTVTLDTCKKYIYKVVKNISISNLLNQFDSVQELNNELNSAIETGFGKYYYGLAKRSITNNLILKNMYQFVEDKMKDYLGDGVKKSYIISETHKSLLYFYLLLTYNVVNINQIGSFANSVMSFDEILHLFYVFDKMKDVYKLETFKVQITDLNVFRKQHVEKYLNYVKTLINEFNNNTIKNYILNKNLVGMNDIAKKYGIGVKQLLNIAKEKYTELENEINILLDNQTTYNNSQSIIGVCIMKDMLVTTNDHVGFEPKSFDIYRKIIKYINLQNSLSNPDNYIELQIDDSVDDNIKFFVITHVNNVVNTDNNDVNYSNYNNPLWE